MISSSGIKTQSQQGASLLKGVERILGGHLSHCGVSPRPSSLLSSWENSPLESFHKKPTYMEVKLKEILSCITINPKVMEFHVDPGA